MKQRFSTRTRLVSALLTLAMVFTFLPFSAFAATDSYGPVYISDLIFPDETFLKYVKRFDKDNNGTLSPEERYKVTEIDVESKNISNLYGIQFFPNLKNLNCADNNLTSLDVSENTVLAELWCYGNQLTELDVSKNTKLKKLRCQKNQLTSLDVSKNTELEYLAVFYNQLTSLDMSQNRKLTFLSCYNNQLTSLNVSKNPALEELYCAQNNLTSLDVSKNTNLKKLICRANQLTELDVSKNPALDELGCEKNQLTSLDVSENPALLSLKCGENQLTELDVSKNPALRYLNCENSQLTNLNVENTNIDPTPWLFSGLYAPGNAYSIAVGSDRAFDLSNLPGKFDVTKASGWGGGTVSGKTLRVNTGETQVTYTYDCGKGYSETFTLNVTVVPEGSIGINASNFPDPNFRAYVKAKFDKNNDNFLSESERNAVTSIDLHNGYNGQKLVSLDGIEHFPNLTTLICYNNQLTSLDVSKNTGLLTLSCYENNLTSLDVSQNTKLEELLCGKNQLTELDVRNNTALWCLSCYENKLTSLDVSHNTQLEQLDCGRNQLTELDVHNNTKLWYLACSENKLTSLDLSQNTKLNELYCSDNQLTSLDVSQTVVATLKASGNQIDINVETTPRTFDLSTLPGFDVTKASGWVGGTVDGSTLKVDAGATQVTYTYDCGKGRSIDFTLNVKVVPDGTVTPPSGGGTGTTTPPSGGGTGTTTPPSGGDGTGTTTPPSGGDGTGTVTPPSGGSTGGDGGGAAIIMVAGAAVAGVVGYGVYNYVSGQKLQALLPEGVAAPENRAQTALLLWNTAGRPEPAEAPAFADVTDPDTAKAAQWCVEQSLMKRRLNGKFAPDSSIPAYQVLNAYRKLAG